MKNPLKLVCNHVANWQWTLNPINQWPVLPKLKQIQKKDVEKKHKQGKLSHLERLISLSLVAQKIQGWKLINSSTFQGFHAVFKAQTKFKNFSRQGLKFKHFSNCCAPCNTSFLFWDRPQDYMHLWSGYCRKPNTPYAISGNQMKFFKEFLCFSHIFFFSDHTKIFFTVTKLLHQSYREWSR